MKMKVYIEKKTQYLQKNYVNFLHSLTILETLLATLKLHRKLEIKQ